MLCIGGDMKSASLLSLWAVILVAAAGCAEDEQLSSQQAAATGVYMGCYSDGPDRGLPHLGGVRDDMTPALCQSLCGGYQYAGTQWYSECWCGNELRWNQIPQSSCNTPCKGDPGTMCGGGWANSVYTVPAPAPAPAADPLYEGCYSDGPNRGLPYLAAIRDDMTPQLCQSLCAGYEYSGTQAYHECWCGNEIRWNKLPESSCNLPCWGDASQTCGGAWANSIRDVPGYEGCFTDGPQRALPYSQGYHADMTPTKCQSLCRTANHKYAGVQWYGECWCGDSLGYSQVSDLECGTPCTGDANQYCGGGWRNSVYSVGGEADERLNAAERQSFCTQMCNHDLACFGDNPSPCMVDCANEALSFARGPAYDFLGCLDSSCQSAEDQCLLYQPVRAIDQQYAAACSAYFSSCGLWDAGLCDINNAAAGAEIRLYRGDYVAGYIDCFGSPCGELDACVDNL